MAMRCSITSPAPAPSARVSLPWARTRRRPISAGRIPTCRKSSRGLMPATRSDRGLIRAPIGRHAIEIVDVDFLAAIAPIEFLIGGERRRALELLVSDVDVISAERAIVFQPRPRDWQMLVAD